MRDTTLGMEWLEYTASNGSHYAAYRVGKEYLKGEIVKKDMGRALRYLTDAANAENQGLHPQAGAPAGGGVGAKGV